MGAAVTTESAAGGAETGFVDKYLSDLPAKYQLSDNTDNKTKRPTVATLRDFRDIFLSSGIVKRGRFLPSCGLVYCVRKRAF
jgi:hypothetical protein